MHYIIYKTTNTTNGKIYIGLHKQLALDFDGYYGSGTILKRSIDKHGIDNFKRETLFVFDTLAEVRAKEKELVTEEFCTRSDNYNISVGGTGGNTTAGLTPQQKMLISEKTKQVKLEKGSNIYSGEKLKNAQIRMKNIRIQPDNRGLCRSQELKDRWSTTKKDKHLKWITDGDTSRLIHSTDIIPNSWNIGRDPNYKRFTAHTQESKNIISKKIKGDKCYNNGIVNLKLKVGQSPPDGFKLGMIQHHLPKHWITNGTINKKHLTNTSIPTGWYRGRTIGKKYE
jgi:hypothetical protein